MPYATTAQIIAAYEALPNKKLVALRVYAGLMVKGTDFPEPLDLVQEAMCRALEGERKWPLGIKFHDFLAGTMKSIVFSERKRVASREKTHAKFEVDPAFVRRPEDEPRLDEMLIAKERQREGAREVAAFRKALAGDAAALSVFAGMLGELTPEEARVKYALDAREFDAARHRVRRLMDARARLH